MSFYNEAAHLKQALDSILGQDFPDFELVVVNDGSTDGSEAIVLHAQRQDSRIKYLGNTQGIGLTRALIAATHSASGKYIARQDADDYSMQARLSAQFGFLEANRDCVMVGTGRYSVDASGNVLRANRLVCRQALIRRLLPYGNVFTHGSTMFRRDAYDRVGGYDARFRYAQDFDLWLRLSSMGTVANLPARLYAWRQSAASITSSRIALQSVYAVVAAIRHAGLIDQPELDSLLEALNKVDDDTSAEELLFDYLKRSDAGRAGSIAGNVFMRCGVRRLAIRSWRMTGVPSDRFKAFLSRNRTGYQALNKAHIWLGLPVL